MNVLIYDGECNMCSRFIQFIVLINKNKDFYITDFNSNWTKKNVKLNPDIDSMIYLKENNIFIYSDAVIRLISELNCLFKLTLLLLLIPKKIRDKLYGILANNRKKIFKNNTCKLPSEKFRQLYLS